MEQHTQKANDLKLSQERYWHLLLHMVDGVSEIDDSAFFFAADGKTNAKHELEATLDAFFNESRFDDNASACRFPARKAWLQKSLEIEDFPDVKCSEYDATVERLAPKSVTLVFPSAHINSPASMFGHTFLRINSRYNSKLLAYAINYAANADPDKENATVFAIKGLFGGYFGKYSLLPYYEKLKEYRDAEQRDIWEYDLNLNEEETLAMVRHIWELNGTESNYYFFTENCSYNMLWLMEVARPNVHLREHFHYEVIPLETVHATRAEGLISSENYRASKRTILLRYEELINEKNITLVQALIDETVTSQELLDNKELEKQQKMYILEAAVEFLEYSYSKNSMSKEKYLDLFHTFTKTRASLGEGELLTLKTPHNPVESHRAIRLKGGFGYREGEPIGFVGLRPAYHDLKDSSLGFLRGTQIEFLDFLLSYNEEEELKIEDATILSIVSLAQRSEFFHSFSWRVKLGWDRDYLKESANFSTSVGAGLSFGNKDAYFYFMLDPLFYMNQGFVGGIGGSAGIVIDKYDFMQTNLELTKRYYDGGKEQSIVACTQSFRLSQNLQVQLKYDYKEREEKKTYSAEQTAQLSLNYYF
ncbi:MAG: DUF4105 domain-containing protein [Campylobacterales bacterium]|nr:DUF4105 domain-containing protein [Campylobacterales bacterium]